MWITPVVTVLFRLHLGSESTACIYALASIELNASTMQVEGCELNASGMRVECEWNASGMRVECEHEHEHERERTGLQVGALEAPGGQFWCN